MVVVDHCLICNKYSAGFVIVKDYLSGTILFMRKTLAEIRAEQLKAKLVQANPFILNDNCKCYDAKEECKCVDTTPVEIECDDCIVTDCDCNENTEE